MDYLARWEKVKPLGQGGQGVVYLVSPRHESASWENVRNALMNMTASVVYDGTQDRAIQAFRKCLLDTIKMYDSAQQGALKILHKPEDARDHSHAMDRIKREIEVMSANIHPSFVGILDADKDSEWYVSKYCPNGTLAEKRGLFAGDLYGAIKAVRSVVEGVAELHKRGYVHRDIKPHNVFLDENNNLLLGDFGLLHFEDNQHTRFSATYENVGSRDWMPGWAMGMRIDQVRPTFDVFSLGKLLWSLVSGRPILQLWYYSKPEFNVELMFPKSRVMRLANSLFAKCIVEEEEDCLVDAQALLEEIDKVLCMIESDGEPFPSEGGYRCRACRTGTYKVEVSDGANALRNFLGCSSPGVRHWRILTCSHCGNVQIFSYADEVPEGWHRK